VAIGKKNSGGIEEVPSEKSGVDASLKIAFLQPEMVKIVSIL
jgi:hypothetical protein